MTRFLKYQFFLMAALLLLLVGGFVQIASAQVEQDTLKNIRSDTSQVRRELNQQKQKVIRQYHFDRSTHKYLSSESNRFNVPTPTKYYKPPLTGQKSLNAAVEALNDNLINKLMNSRIYRIITKIAPYINNIFVFGYFNELPPIVAPDNPYLYPQTKKGQAYLNFIESRDSSPPEKEKQE